MYEMGIVGILEVRLLRFRRERFKLVLIWLTEKLRVPYARIAQT